MAVRHLPIGEPHPDAPTTPATPAMTLLFWIKAGIGFSIGVCIVAPFVMFLWARIFLPLYLRLFLGSF